MKLLLFVILLLLSNILLAQDFDEIYTSTETVNNSGFGMGVSASTFGPGLSLFYQFNQPFRIKASANYFNYNYSLQKLLKELDGNANIKVGGIGFYIDLQFLRFFYASTGVTSNFNKVNVNGKMANSVQIGDVEITPDDIGIVGIKIEPTWNLCPYIGLGGGRLLSSKNKFGFALEVGTYFQGSPDVDLSATGMLEPTASTEQEELMEENIKPIDFWPQVALKVSYKFK